MRLALAIPAALLVALLLLPVLALWWRGLPSMLAGGLLLPEAVAALGVSLRSTAVAVAVIMVLATPTALLLARTGNRGRGWRLLEAMLDLPVVLPPVVAGLGLLFAFGRNGLLGPGLAWFGLELAFSFWAVVLAQVFTASPYYLRAARAGFAAIDPELLAAAALDGATPWQAFWRLRWPLAWPFIAEGLVLATTRALGEFGATVLFAGSLVGQTRTMTLAVYTALEGSLESALALALLMTVLAFVALAMFRVLSDTKNHR
jgi:molybdate transport system permease protein